MRLRQLLLLLICLNFTGVLSAQTYVRSNAIAVVHGTDTLRAAWAGGLQSPQFNAIDLDNDGLLDQVIFDRLDGSLHPFLNGGTPNAVDFDYAPQFLPDFPSDIQHWLFTADYDRDGYRDLFCGTAQGSNVQVYRNTSANTAGNLSFVRVKNALYSFYPPILPLYSAANDYPAIADIDEDGDLDILAFHVSGGFVEWHRNMSIENHGHSDSLEFELQSNCFGHFEEDSQTCDADIGLAPCGQGQRVKPEDFSAANTALHAGSTLLAMDLDGDRIKELVVGDVGCQTLYALHNGGTLSIAHFDFVESGYPSQPKPVNVLNFPAAFYIDMDNDSVRDLVAAPNATAEIEDRRGVEWQKNIGNDSVPDFVPMGYGLAQDQMIETGTGAIPSFLDYNADGLQDLLLGNFGHYDSAGGLTASLRLYENVGTALLPAFSLVDADYLGLSHVPLFSSTNFMAPAAGDLDADGDVDLLIGEDDGRLIHYQNTAGASATAIFVFASTNFAGIDVGLNSAPCLHDLDQDQDLDLLIGNHRGFLKYYENIGTPQVPQFVLAVDSFGQVKINDFTEQPFTNGYARPCLLNLDQDAALELLVGGVEGKIQVYDNVSTQSGAVFARLADFGGVDVGSYAAPAVAHLDASGWTVVCGTFRGGLQLLRNGGPLALSETAHEDMPHLRLYPNPTRERLQVELEGLKTTATLTIVDAMGRVLLADHLSVGGSEYDLSGWPGGLYFVRVQDGKRIQAARFLKLD